MSPGGCGVRSSTAAISAGACCRAAAMFYTNQRVTGRGLLNALRSNCSSRRRLIMREKVEMLFGHLKRISDWTNCAYVAKRCGKQTDPRTHRQSSPHEARRVKLRLARKCRGRTSPSSERGILQRQPLGTTIRGPCAASDAAGNDPPAFSDQLS
jgi:hypothetical protein